jgi:Cu2+-containing amine oxidase
MIRRVAASTLWLVIVGLAAAPAAQAQCSGINLVEQKFPLVGPEQTRWRVCWQEQAKNGLVITAAFFRTAPNKPWIRILWDGRISEIFVPYHDGSPRYYDVTNFTFNLVPVAAVDCPASVGGLPLGAHVCKEVRDRGLAWKDYGQVRRGQEVALWAGLGAGNYNYVMEWVFRDDGILLGRVGATAANLPSKPMMPHMHNPIWRLDVDLDGFANDSVAFATHTEASLNGVDTEPMIATETGKVWDPHAFNSLDIMDANLKNAKGHQTMYRLMPLPASGLSRHQEPFTQQDFWVTRYDPSEMFAKSLTTYVNPPQPVTNADIVVWYKGSLHHHPRDEDGEFVTGGWRGEALIMWTGFMLMPHDLFDRTPLIP